MLQGKLDAVMPSKSGTRDGKGTGTSKHRGDEERIAINARLSRASAEGWRGFCQANGISLSAFLEVVGLNLAGDTAPSRIPERDRMVEAARAVDIERRNRRS